MLAPLTWSKVMTLRITLVRHSKSCYKLKKALGDQHRPLAARGTDQLKKLKKYMDKIPVTVAVSSKATRNIDTAMAFTDTLKVDSALYGLRGVRHKESVSEFLKLVDRHSDPDTAHLAIVGHRVMLNRMIQHWVKAGAIRKSKLPQYAKGKGWFLPTGSAITLEFDNVAEAMKPKTGRIVKQLIQRRENRAPKPKAMKGKRNAKSKRN